MSSALTKRQAVAQISEQGAADSTVVMAEDTLNRSSILLDHAMSQFQLLAGFLENLTPEELEKLQPPGLRRLTLLGVIQGIHAQVGRPRSVKRGRVVRFLRSFG